MPARRPLFISLTRTCIAFRDGRITSEQLSSGLYYFGCAKPFAYGPMNHGAQSAEFVARCLRSEGTSSFSEALLCGIHESVKIGLQQAERDGRCSFRPDDGVATYGQLNELLVSNGYPKITADLVEPITRDDQPHDLSYETLRKRISRAGISLDVIF